MKRFALAAAAMMTVTGGSAEATTFNFTFDDLGGGGKGVLSVEKALTAGTFNLSEVGAFSLDFTAFGDFRFTNDNIRTSVSSVLLVVSGEAGSLNLLFSNTKPYGDGPREGSLDLIGTSNFLSFAAPGGSDGFPDNTYFIGPFRQRPFFGRYSAVEAATPAIPEPATWMMMLAGFGMIGAATRYRSRKLAVAY